MLSGRKRSGVPPVSLTNSAIVEAGTMRSAMMKVPVAVAIGAAEKIDDPKCKTPCPSKSAPLTVKVSMSPGKSIGSVADPPAGGNVPPAAPSPS